MDEQDVKIAVLDTKLEGLREQQKVHSDDTKKGFEKVMDTLRPISEFVVKNGEIPKTVEMLEKAHNKQTGFLNASRIFAGAIGGGIAVLGEWLLTGGHK